MHFLRQYGVEIACILAFLLMLGCIFLFAPPRSVVSPTLVTVHAGESVSAIADMLGHAGVVAHPRALTVLLRFSHTSMRVQAGTYLFEGPEGLVAVARRLVTGEYRMVPVSITFPEGVTARDIAESVAEVFSPTLAVPVRTLAKSHEGYLFPDTYLFSRDVSAEDMIETMRKNFVTKLALREKEIEASSHSLAEVITLASLVEKEARTDQNRRMVAGVLLNRLAREMPLQVDAVFGYIFERDTYSPSYADLKVDSPYNTYTHTGLPPGPINNPGLASVDAVLSPITTHYMYYLTDKNGVMHYATTYAEHQANEKRYLR